MPPGAAAAPCPAAHGARSRGTVLLGQAAAGGARQRRAAQVLVGQLHALDVLLLLNQQVA